MTGGADDRARDSAWVRRGGKPLILSACALTAWAAAVARHGHLRPCGTLGWRQPCTNARLTPDVIVSDPVPARGPSGLLNEHALLEMLDALYGRVRSSLAAGRFPVVYGADCSVLLAAVPALADVAGDAGLVFIDGHEDATPMELSASGEAATDFHADPSETRRQAARQVTSQAPGCWLHIDLGVLDREEFSACGAAGECMLPGGLSWAELGALASSALRASGIRGWSLGIYNPDLDPQGRSARRIVNLMADAIKDRT